MCFLLLSESSRHLNLETSFSLSPKLGFRVLVPALSQPRCVTAGNSLPLSESLYSGGVE